MIPRLVVLTLFAVGLMGAGCSFLSARKDPTRFYELTAATTNRPPASPKTNGPVIVVALNVAGYLDKTSLAQRVAANQISYFPFDQWAQPFAENANQALRAGLAAATGLPVVSANQSYVIRDFVQIKVQLHRFDVLPDHRVQVEASWQITTSRAADRLRQGQFSQERSFTPAANSLQPAVAVESELLAEIGLAIAADLP